MQSELAKSSVGIEIARNHANGVQAEADGESYRLEEVGRASAVKTDAEGLAIAKGLNAQQEAVGRDQTAFINVVRELSQGTQRFMPENLALTRRRRPRRPHRPRSARHAAALAGQWRVRRGRGGGQVAPSPEQRRGAVANAA
jgi:hypothetical protein